MQDNTEFDFFGDFTIPEQNSFLRTYLTETTKHLRPIPFLHSPGYFYFENVFIDDQFHGNNITNLATLLNLLVSREFVRPIRFLNGNPIHKPTGTELAYFSFTADIKYLHSFDAHSFEYFDVAQAAKVVEN